MSTTTPTGTYRIEIPGWVPTPLNQLLGHWRGRWGRKKADKAMVLVHAWKCRIPPADGRRRVSLLITLPPGQRRWDPDCFWKSCLDALVAARLLKDDSSKWCELGTIIQMRTGVLSTTIILEDLPPEGAER
jgi:hypothetical protein